MRLITTLAAAAGFAALAACDAGAGEENTANETLDVNTMVVENLTMPGDNMATDLNGMDMNTTVDMNATTDLNAGTTTGTTDDAAANTTGNTTY